MRILLFLATNLAVLVLVSLVFNLLGFQSILQANGVDLNLTALLVFCALFGFGGSFISLLLSKWMAKRSTGTQIIEQPRNSDEQWLLDDWQLWQCGYKNARGGHLPIGCRQRVTPAGTATMHWWRSAQAC